MIEKFYAPILSDKIKPIMSWQLLLTISILAGSAGTILQRYIQKDSKINPLAFIIWPTAIGAILGLGLEISHGFDTRWYLLPKFNVLLSMLLYPAANYCYVMAMQRSEASQFSVLFTTRVFWSVLVSIIFLHETISGLILIGALFLFVSCIIAIWEESFSIKNKATIFPLLTAMFLGLALANDGIILSHGFDVLSYEAIAFVSTPIILPLISKSARVASVEMLRDFKKMLGMSALAICYALSSVLLFYAFNKGQKFSVLSSLNQTQTVVVVLAAAILLRERRYIMRRLVAAIISFIGVLLIINA
jgi:drug/metabolite transporter (DMT)-like permease